MNEELKPCPFCGGEAKIINLIEAEPEMQIIGCTANNWNVICDCGASGTTGRTDIEAIEAWNRRAE